MDDELLAAKGALRGSLAQPGFLADCCPGRATVAQSRNPRAVWTHARPAELDTLRPGAVSRPAGALAPTAN